MVQKERERVEDTGYEFGELVKPHVTYKGKKRWSIVIGAGVSTMVLAIVVSDSKSVRLKTDLRLGLSYTTPTVILIVLQCCSCRHH
jgi:hypothetical protein